MAPSDRDVERAFEQAHREVEALQVEAENVVRDAVEQMVAAARAAANGGGTPNAESIRAAARQAWDSAVQAILAWLRRAITRLITGRLERLPRTSPTPGPRDPDSVVPGVPEVPGPRPLPDGTRARVDEMAADYVREAGNRLVNVPDQVWEQVQHQLAEGFERGETPQELRERVAQQLDTQEWAPEAERIARTETTGAFNYAQARALDAAETELGERLRRMWIATQDNRTRPTHRRAHRQIVESGEPFRVGGFPLRYPGDPLGPADEVINCRCVAVAVAEDLVIGLSPELIEREREAMEREFRGASVAADVDEAQPSLEAVMPPQLLQYWTAGEGAAKIAWGSPGDFTRCDRYLAEYIHDDSERKGACARLHKLTTGKWPNERGMAADGEMGDSMACPCEAVEATDDTEPAEVVTAEHTSGMIALIPSEADVQRLALEDAVQDDGTPMPLEELHVTLLFLGEAAQWGSEQQAAVHQLAADIAAIGPVIEGNAWAAAAFNPGTDDECVVYLVGDNTGTLSAMHESVCERVHELGDVPLPEQHNPWIPHCTATYRTSDVARLVERVGPITLDRIRVAFGGEYVDYPLVGQLAPEIDDEDRDELDEVDTVEDLLEASAGDAGKTVTARADDTGGEPVGTSTETAAPVVTAAAVDAVAIVAQAVENAPEAPPAEWFEDQHLTAATPITVTPEGQVFGHIALWNSCHRGFEGECVPPPPSSTIDYELAHHKDVVTADGTQIRAGQLIVGCPHAADNAPYRDAREYHEAMCTPAANVRFYEDEHGIVAAGSLVPGLTVEDVAKLRHISGEWRTVSLELMAAVGVDNPGFPVAPLDAETVAVTASADLARAMVAHIPRRPVDPLHIVERAAERAAEKAVEALEARQQRAQALEAATAVVAQAQVAATAREINRYTKRGSN
ncbi:phage minor head protein [Amycolatopsis thermophila]|uniref:SPP1 gp7 family putative phage head morphogenesis protein n=1 Tax=Amycolatopsis thermophila TaxID=206084 RepID=A0ABU0EMN9_9PSEU|nr:phage minor head protein [Amycolatopsis thermophila]MDQ0376502.1 SPP1 gp7 family putative phage head morphogenesis protein [Amycolatopsis thermophila]